MASRQEEKEKRKQERIAREAAAAAAAKRARMLQTVGGVIVGAAVIGGVAFAISAGGGSDIDEGKLKAAAQASGCVYRAFPEEGRNHIDKVFKASDYKTNPPTSGDHVPTGSQAPDGIYVAGNEPGIGNWVHTLEHGRIEYQYRPGVDKSVVTALESLFNEDVKGSGSGYHSVLMRNNTKMPFQVAAVAWRHYMACATFTPKSISALRTFRDAFVDKGPELVP